MKRILSLLFLIALSALGAQAELRRAEIKVFGMD